jgi:hypothetical protein
MGKKTELNPPNLGDFEFIFSKKIEGNGAS